MAVKALHSALVTGASGFIGQHLVRRLQSMDIRVKSVSKSAGLDILHDDLPLEGIDRVFHVAGRAGVVDAWENPVDYFTTNALGTMRVLDQCRRYSVPVTNLSAYIYGHPKRLPISETDPVEVSNPYAFSKYVAEQTCTFYAQNFKANCVSLRLFNAYGPGQPDSFLIPFIMRQVLDPACSVVEVKDLSPRRDYVYIDDVVEAIIGSVDAPPGAILNVGSGTAYSVEDVLKMCLKAAEIDKPYRETGVRRQNELDCVVADIAAIRQAFGWRPEVSMESGLRRLWSHEGGIDR